MYTLGIQCPLKGSWILWAFGVRTETVVYFGHSVSVQRRLYTSGSQCPLKGSWILWVFSDRSETVVYFGHSVSVRRRLDTLGIQCPLRDICILRAFSVRSETVVYFGHSVSVQRRLYTSGIQCPFRDGWILWACSVRSETVSRATSEACGSGSIQLDWESASTGPCSCCLLVSRPWLVARISRGYLVAITAEPWKCCRRHSRHCRALEVKPQT